MKTVKCEWNGLEYEYEPVDAEDIVMQVNYVAQRPVEAIRAWLHTERELAALKAALEPFDLKGIQR